RGDVVDGQGPGAEAQLRADRDRCREPDLVGAVVHAHRDASDLDDGWQEARAQGEGEVPEGDGAAEGTGLGPLDVDVDPLVVAGGVGELVHLVLGDLDPVAVAEVLADAGLEPVDAVDDGRHGRLFKPETRLCGMHCSAGAGQGAAKASVSRPLIRSSTSAPTTDATPSGLSQTYKGGPAHG